MVKRIRLSITWNTKLLWNTLEAYVSWFFFKYHQKSRSYCDNRYESRKTRVRHIVYRRSKRDIGCGHTATAVGGARRPSRSRQNDRTRHDEATRLADSICEPRTCRGTYVPEQLNADQRAGFDHVMGNRDVAVFRKIKFLTIVCSPNMVLFLLTASILFHLYLHMKGAHTSPAYVIVGRIYSSK